MSEFDARSTRIDTALTAGLAMGHSHFSAMGAVSRCGARLSP